MGRDDATPGAVVPIQTFGNLADLNPHIHIDENGYWAGYFLGFGSNDNACNKILAQGELVTSTENDATPIEKGKTHHVIGEFDGKKVCLTIDGKKELEYKVEEALVGEGHEKVGFYVYTQGKFDNIKVYTKLAKKD